MENIAYKIYELEDVLSLYTNMNGISVLSNRQNMALDRSDKKKESELISNEDEVDARIERDFLDDVDVPENETKEVQISRIKRYQMIVKNLKKKYKNKCQLCGYSFRMDNGNDYCEAHHIKMLSNDGSQSPENTIILCANHHRMFHYATNICVVGELCNGKRIIKIGSEEYKVQF